MAQALTNRVPDDLTAASAAALIDAEVACGTRTLTPLGKALLEARRAIEESGELAADEEELKREKRKRRGGAEDRP